jgi:hypothetical protein
LDTPLFSASALLIALATAAYLIHAPQSPRQERSQTPRRARIVLFASAFASAFLLVPPVAAAVDRVTGHGGTGALLFSLTSGLTIVSMQLVTVDWWLPAIYARRAVVTGIAFYGAVMAVLVWEFGHINNASSAQLFSAPSGNGAEAAFVLTHLGFLDVMAIAVSLQYAALTHSARARRHPITAAGLAVSALGALLGLAYSLARTGAAIAHLTGQPWPAVMETHVVPITGALAALLVTVGFMLPTVRKRILMPHGRAATGPAAKDNAVRRIALP